MLTKVEIKQSYRDGIQLNDLIRWNPNVKPYEVDENSNYFLDIQVNEGDLIYLEGLEQLDITGSYFSDKIGYDDELNEWYIKKSCKIYFFDTNHGEYGYVPGYYKISMIKGHKRFNSWIHVRSKLINDNEYNQMVTDLEGKVPGLSQTNKRGKHGVIIVNDIDTDNRRIDILVKNFNSFQESMFRVSRNPRSEIGTEYRWSSKNDVGMDYRSTIKMSSNPQKNKRYLKRHVVNYNTRGNIFLKHCLLQIRDIANDLYSKYGKDIGSNSKILKTYISLIDDLTMRSWLNEVSNSYLENTQVGSALMNYSYNFIMKLNTELHDLKSIKNAKKDNFAYYRKSSQELYELWGYVQVIEGLERRGYKYRNGLEKVLDKYGSLSQNIKDGFKEGTSIVLEKEEEYKHRRIKTFAKVIYDKAIPEKTYGDLHLWTTGRHNKPDIRIDFFDASYVYIGSAIIDTKYRKRSNFMRGELSHGARDQLNEYASSIRSDDEYDSDEFKIDFVHLLRMNNFKSAECIRKVGVMYPGRDKIGYGSFIENKVISKIVEKPGENLKNIDRFLNDSIHDILETYEYALK